MTNGAEKETPYHKIRVQKNTPDKPYCQITQPLMSLIFIDLLVFILFLMKAYCLITKSLKCLDFKMTSATLLLTFTLSSIVLSNRGCHSSSKACSFSSMTSAFVTAMDFSEVMPITFLT